MPDTSQRRVAMSCGSRQADLCGTLGWKKWFDKFCLAVSASLAVEGKYTDIWHNTGLEKHPLFCGGFISCFQEVSSTLLWANRLISYFDMLLLALLWYFHKPVAHHLAMAQTDWLSDPKDGWWPKWTWSKFWVKVAQRVGSLSFALNPALGSLGGFGYAKKIPFCQMKCSNQTNLIHPFVSEQIQIIMSLNKESSLNYWTWNYVANAVSYVHLQSFILTQFDPSIPCRRQEKTIFEE